jgi:hypothetical protein
MSETVLPIRPLCFLENPTVIEGSDEIVIPKWLFESWIDLFPPSTPMIITIKAIDTGMERYLCVNGSGPDDAVYCPNWILENMGLGGEAEEYVTLLPHTEEIETATKISIRLLGDAGSLDVRSAVESYIDRFHVLEAGTMLTVPVSEIEIPMFVERVEPSCLVRLGGEVIVEFLEEEEADEETGDEDQDEELMTAISNSVSNSSSSSKEEQEKKPLTAEEIRLRRLEFLTKQASASLTNEAP